MPVPRIRSLRHRFGVRALLLSLALLGAVIIGTGVFWRARLMRDLTDGLSQHIASVESELETLHQFGQFPSDGTGPYVLTAPERGVQVVSSHGEVLAASPQLIDTEPVLSPDSVLSEPTTTATTVIDHRTFGHVLVAGEEFSVGGERYAVEAITSLADVDQAARITFVLGPIAALVIAGGIGVAVAVSVQSALRPVHSLTHRAADIASGRRPMRLGVHAQTTELDDLTAQLDHMLERIRATFDREQAFLDDASHELRTPIAIARTELELARRESSDPATKVALDSAIEELDRVHRTASELLLLARARAAGDRGFDSIDLGELVERTAERLRHMPRGAQAQIHTAGSGIVLGDEPALERALLNLIGNAVEHAGQSVMVTIEAGDPVELRIVDDGPGFPEQILEHLFDRFTRGPDRRKHGTGLGTAIASEIVAVHGGSISAGNRPEGGGVIVVQLPAAPELT